MMSTYPGKSPSTSTSKSPLAGVQKVVVVNSSPDILPLAERALAAGHYDVVFVESTSHAYSQIRRVKPNLVVLGLRMADAEAFQVLSMLKLDPETRDISLLTFTADDDMADQLEEEAEGTDDSEFLADPPRALMN